MTKIMTIAVNIAVDLDLYGEMVFFNTNAALADLHTSFSSYFGTGCLMCYSATVLQLEFGCPVLDEPILYIYISNI